MVERMRWQHLPRLVHWVNILLIVLITTTGCGKVPGISLGNGTKVPTQPLPGTAEPASPEDEPKTPSLLAMREVVGYYTGPEGTIPTSESVLVKQAEHLSYIAGFWYQIHPDHISELRTMDNAPEWEIRRIVDLAHSLGVKVEVLFHNLLYGSGNTSRTVINRLLADPTAINSLADNLISLVERMAFDGVNIDIEWVAPSSRSSFTAFVKILAEKLREAGVRVSLSVPAKTWDDPNNGWAGGYDYAALGALVDRVMLMTYDEHGYSTGPGAVASSGWVRQVVSYAVQVIPAEKLLVGLPSYGFDWADNKSVPTYLDYQRAMVPVHGGKATLQWDTSANVPKYLYRDVSGVTHQVWFENASSSSWKLDLVHEFNLCGFTLWRLGMEDPALWEVVGQKMIAR
jgi:spore germination protein